MYKQEKIKPYEGQGDKGKLVEEMFDNIAPTYDTLNHRLSWDIDKGWRKKAIKQLAKHLAEEIVAPEKQVVSILQADCMEDAKALQAHLEELVPGIRCRTEMVGPTICAHAGPGTLAVVFLGNERDRT